MSPLELDTEPLRSAGSASFDLEAVLKSFLKIDILFMNKVKWQIRSDSSKLY